MKTDAPKKVRKASVRKCFGIVKWIDVGERRYKFTLTKAGLGVHQKCRRNKEDDIIPFDALTLGGGHEIKEGSTTVKFRITDKGVEVRRGSSKRVELVTFAALSNISRVQPELFVEGAK